MTNISICLYPTDFPELELVQNIQEQFTKLGHEVVIDSTMSKEADVGLFCAHHLYNKPELVKTSFVMLHDLGQAHGRWPHFWHREPWGQFDYGILPNKFWNNMFIEEYVSNVSGTLLSYLKKRDLSNTYLASMDLTLSTDLFPKRGMAVIGWPKVTSIMKQFLEETSGSVKFKADNQRLTVLYAPSWEFNAQQDKFIKAIVDLPVNILIKQQYWEGAGGAHLRRVKEMQDLHEGRWPNVRILDPRTGIFEGLSISDCLVSDESSTLIEAGMVGVVPISVSDWLIPDKNPPRPPSVPYPFVKKILQSELRQEIELLCTPRFYQQERSKLRDYQEYYSAEYDNPAGKICDFIINTVSSN